MIYTKKKFIRSFILQAFFALLFCISSLYGMKRNQAMLTNEASSTMHHIFATDDILYNIFKELCPITKSLSERKNVLEIAKKNKVMQLVCKEWEHTFNPTTIRKLFAWKAVDIAKLINTCPSEYAHRNHFLEYFSFCASMLQDKPDLINLHHMIKNGSLTYIRIALENCTNPNLIRDRQSPLLYAMKKSDNLPSGPKFRTEEQKICHILELLVKHGANIHEDSGNGSSIAKRLVIGQTYLLPLLTLGALYLLFYYPNDCPPVFVYATMFTSLLLGCISSITDNEIPFQNELISVLLEQKILQTANRFLA